MSDYRRILIVDDTPSIHEDILKVFDGGSTCQKSLDRARSRRPGRASAPAGVPAVKYRSTSVFQGPEAREAVEQSLRDQDPYALAIVDMCMPPGWDGIETIEQLWQVDPNLQVVICSDDSEDSWQEMVSRIDHSDRLLVLKRPFEDTELVRMAHALTEKWNLEREIGRRLEDLERANRRLEGEMQFRRRLEDRVRHDAMHDELTDLPNRALLMDRIERCIVRGRRHQENHYAVLFLDLDDFQLVNDTMGHKAGDLLLIEASRRLAGCIRSLDSIARPEEGTTARIGGDEFVVLLDGVATQEDVLAVATRVQATLSRPFLVEGRHIQCTTSIGIATGLDEYDCPDDILRDADIALYHAKDKSNNSRVVFKHHMRKDVVHRLSVGNDLRRAIDDGRQFVLHYQPIVTLPGGEIEGFEALIRWHHPVHGMIAPGDFITIAEETGLIVPIGEWILKEACFQLKSWRTVFPEFNDLSVSVNISSRQFSAGGLANCVIETLERTDIEPRHLNLEITETTVMESSDTVQSTLRDLVAAGLALRMDDFGTGYSSLSTLHEYPFTDIKLDRSFIQTMTQDSKHLATVRAVVDLTHNHGKRVIAEGIETAEQRDILSELGCDLGQGFYFSRPVVPEEVSQLLRTGGHWATEELVAV